MAKFLVEIDGRPEALVETSLDDAQAEAFRRAEGVRSMKITITYDGAVPIPSDAYYYDYEERIWVHCPNAAHAVAKRKGE